ncbi:MAG: hypothetical protein ACF8OB_16190, partial [Phycisphaeraceae bacterium JB051]
LQITGQWGYYEPNADIFTDLPQKRYELPWIDSVNAPWEQMVTPDDMYPSVFVRDVVQQAVEVTKMIQEYYEKYKAEFPDFEL